MQCIDPMGKMGNSELNSVDFYTQVEPLRGKAKLPLLPCVQPFIFSGFQASAKFQGNRISVSVTNTHKNL
jgi:hypothetical protein